MRKPQLFKVNLLRIQIQFQLHTYIHNHHGYPGPFLATLLNRPLLPAGFQGYTLYRQSCCIYVRAGRPAFSRPCEGVHWSSSLMSFSLLLQQCPTYLVRLTWILFVMGGKWPYSCYFVGCCLLDLFNIARVILV